MCTGPAWPVTPTTPSPPPCCPASAACSPSSWPAAAPRASRSSRPSGWPPWPRPSAARRPSSCTPRPPRTASWTRPACAPPASPRAASASRRAWSTPMTCGPTPPRRSRQPERAGAATAASETAADCRHTLLQFPSMERTVPPYRLVRQPVPRPRPPVLDDAQQQVVAHAGGPLLVLAGPGTGKTTTIVEAAVERITGRGTDPSRLLVLTFSRKAARELRERIALRLARTTRQPLALTFHSYAYALVRREYVLAGDEPPVLLSGPEQLLEVRRLLRGEAADGGGSWPERLRPALATRGFAAELRDFLLRATERGLDGRGLTDLGARRGRDDWIAAGALLERYAGRVDLAPVPAYDYA